MLSPRSSKHSPREHRLKLLTPPSSRPKQSRASSPKLRMPRILATVECQF